MGDFLSSLGTLLGLGLLLFLRLTWSLIKLLVMAAVLLGCASEVFADAPASWPQFEFSIGVIWEYMALAFITATNGWLPLGIAIIVLWLRGISSAPFREDVTHMKIGLIALLNYLDLEVETVGTNELREEGFKSIIGAWCPSSDNLGQLAA